MNANDETNGWIFSNEAHSWLNSIYSRRLALFSFKDDDCAAPGYPVAILEMAHPFQEFANNYVIGNYL